MNQAILILLFPLLAAFLVPAGTAVSPRFGRALALVSYLAGLAYGIFLYPGIAASSRSVIVAGWLPPYGINLVFTPLTLGIVLALYAAASLLVLFDMQNTPPRKGQYYLLYSLLVSASAAMVLTGDIFNLFVFMEIAGVAAFALIAAGRERGGTEGALRYLIPAQLTSLLMLGGIGILYSATGVLNIASLARFESLKPAFAFMTGLLILLPFLLEAKLFPLNTWVSGAYTGAHPSFAGSLSAITAPAAAIAVARLLLTMMGEGSAFAPAAVKLRTVLLVLGALTILVGETAAFREANLKRVLGFSSVGQMGMIAVGLAISGEMALRGTLLLLLSHTAAKALLFLVTGFAAEAAGTARWKAMRGLGRSIPSLGLLFAVGAMTLIGLPLFAGFWGKLDLLRGGIQAGGIALAGVIAILAGTVVEGVYFMRIAHALFEEGGDFAAARPNVTFLVPAVVLALALLAVGIYPDLIGSWLDSGAAELMNPGRYIELVLSGGGV